MADNYPEKTDETDPRFVSYSIPVSAIATSSGQNDSGMFELNFKDERYLPFEGAGTISTWRLELPSLRQFDYNTISDVIMHVRYTATDGGNQLRRSADQSVREFMKAVGEISEQDGLFCLLDLKHDMPNEWHTFRKEGNVDLTLTKQRLPYLAQSMDITISSVIFFAKVKDNAATFSLTIDTDTSDAAAGTQLELRKINDWQMYRGASSEIKLNSEFNLSAAVNELPKIEGLIMIIKYQGKVVA